MYNYVGTNHIICHNTYIVPIFIKWLLLNRALFLKYNWCYSMSFNYRCSSSLNCRLSFKMRHWVQSKYLHPFSRMTGRGTCSCILHFRYLNKFVMEPSVQLFMENFKLDGLSRQKTRCTLKRGKNFQPKIFESEFFLQAIVSFLTTCTILAVLWQGIEIGWLKLSHYNIGTIR